MAGLVQRMLRDIIKSGKDGIIRSSPDISVLWSGYAISGLVNTYGIFMGSDCICYGHSNEAKPYEIRIPSREKVRQYAPMVADILRASGMEVELFGETIILDGMEVPWNAERMLLDGGKITVLIK